MAVDAATGAVTYTPGADAYGTTKTATVVVNAVPRAFGYVFGDSMAKVLLGRIADPTKDGVTVLGWHPPRLVIDIHRAVCIRSGWPRLPDHGRIL